MNVLWYLDHGDILCTIKVPEDAQVVQIGNKYKCDKFIIESMDPISPLLVKRLIRTKRWRRLYNNTILFWVAKKNRIDIAKALLERRLSVNDYVLYEAIRRGYTELVKIFVKSGIKNMSDGGAYALNVARTYGRLDEMQFILEDLRFVKPEPIRWKPKSKFSSKLKN